jgi:hypothetical protein
MFQVAEVRVSVPCGGFKLGILWAMLSVLPHALMLYAETGAVDAVSPNDGSKTKLLSVCAFHVTYCSEMYC